MEGSKSSKRSPAQGFAFPFQKDFIARLEGPTVTGLAAAPNTDGRSRSGDVLLIASSRMSGSVPGARGDGTARRHSTTRHEDRTHDHVGVPHVVGCRDRVQRSAPLRYMKIIAQCAGDEPLLEGLGPEQLGTNSTPQCWRGRGFHNKTSLKAALLDSACRGLGNISIARRCTGRICRPAAGGDAGKRRRRTDRSRGRLVGAIHSV